MKRDYLLVDEVKQLLTYVLSRLYGRIFCSVLNHITANIVFILGIKGFCLFLEIIVKALRVAMKQSKAFFTELAEAKLLKIQNLQNYQNMKSNDPLGQSSLGLDSMTKLKNLKLKNKGNGMWKRWDETTPKLSSLEQYKNVMLGRGGKSGTVTKRVFHNVKGTGSAKTFLKVKLTQLSKVVEMDDDNIELPTDELSIELDTDELMGGDTVAGADVQDMEV